MTDIARQRRARRIAMSDEERDTFLREQRVCRVATLDAANRPHVTPTWFVWDGEHIWLSSIVRAQRHANILRNPQVAIVVDAGEDYFQLHGVEFSGTAHPVGEQPRDAEPNPQLEVIESAFAAKYLGGGDYASDGQHGWLRFDPQRQYTWDFRKL